MTKAKKAKCWGCGCLIRLTKKGTFMFHKSRHGLLGPKVYRCAAVGGKP